MKITEEQNNEFQAKRNYFLDTIYAFHKGIEFAEKICEVDCRRVHWLEILKEKVNALKDLKELESLDDIHYGMAISNYLSDIEKVFLEEFSKVISPFETILVIYKRDVQRILIGEK